MIPIQHIHPMVVHFPIVLLLLVAAFEIVATLMGLDVTGRTATGNLAVGAIVLRRSRRSPPSISAISP